MLHSIFLHNVYDTELNDTEFLATGDTFTRLDLKFKNKDLEFIISPNYRNYITITKDGGTLIDNSETDNWGIPIKINFKLLSLALDYQQEDYDYECYPIPSTITNERKSFSFLIDYFIPTHIRAHNFRAIVLGRNDSFDLEQDGATWEEGSFFESWVIGEYHHLFGPDISLLAGAYNVENYSDLDVSYTSANMVGISGEFENMTYSYLNKWHKKGGESFITLAFGGKVFDYFYFEEKNFERFLDSNFLPLPDIYQKFKKEQKFREILLKKSPRVLITSDIQKFNESGETRHDTNIAFTYIDHKGGLAYFAPFFGKDWRDDYYGAKFGYMCGNFGVEGKVNFADCHAYDGYDRESGVKITTFFKMAK